MTSSQLALLWLSSVNRKAAALRTGVKVHWALSWTRGMLAGWLLSRKKKHNVHKLQMFGSRQPVFPVVINTKKIAIKIIIKKMKVFGAT